MDKKWLMNDFNTYKILVIDDEKAILKMLHQRLSRMGFAVDLAETGEEGITKINCHPYDLIFTDIKMPGMSGNDLFEYVRSDLKKNVPIIAMSGTPWLLEDSNFNAVISKPCLKKDLLDVLDQFVQTANP